MSRRSPLQARSKERVELIVETARELIGTLGNDAVSVREIAKRAGIPISSIYQYFPDKNAVLREIMQRYLDEIRQQLLQSYAQVDSFEGLLEAVDLGVDRFVQFFLDQPPLAVIWAGVQANPVLSELDATDSLENAKLLSQELIRLEPQINPDKAFIALLFMMHCASATVRLALALDCDLSHALIGEFKQSIRLRLRSLVGK